jgi:hypothetical protein
LPILLVENEGVTCRIYSFSEFRTPEVARAYSGTRMPEISERKITACPTEFRADSGLAEPDPKIREPENPNGQP